ncbi:MAG: DUF2062 domain-containing protein [Ectothiorhodospiraceae bacterium]|nr:DUF2062 domain-containing protein [Ectothiorhodospiraceae bacterium]
MLNAILVRIRAMRWRAHAWLARHPRLQHLLQDRGVIRGGSESIARGVAIGLFIGLTPTVGFQTMLILVCCLLVAGNFPTAFVASFVTNPFTVAPLFWAYHELGRAVFTVFPVLSSDPDVWYLRGVGAEIVFTLTGSLLIATPVAVIGYLLSRPLSAAILAHRRRRIAERRGK